MMITPSVYMPSFNYIPYGAGLIPLSTQKNGYNFVNIHWITTKHGTAIYFNKPFMCTINVSATSKYIRAHVL